MVDGAHDVSDLYLCITLQSFKGIVLTVLSKRNLGGDRVDQGLVWIEIEQGGCNCKQPNIYSRKI